MNATSTKRLLVVDDAMIMRAIIKDTAKKAGWEIAGEATNGAEAVEQYRELQPDMTTLDIVMPEMDNISSGSLKTSFAKVSPYFRAKVEAQAGDGVEQFKGVALGARELERFIR